MGKHCYIWATNIHQQSQGIHGAAIYSQQPKEQKMDPAASSSSTSTNQQPLGAVINTSKFVTEIPYHNQSALSQHSAMNLNGKKWYWLNLEQFSWIPYRDVDNQKLDMAWKSNKKSCFIVSGQYRVDFSRGGENPTGHQYNVKISNPGARDVICHSPGAAINTIPVMNHPL